MAADAMRRYRSIPVVVALLVATACGPGTPRTGSVTVFAAASLTEAFTDLQGALKPSQPGLSITYNFAGSGALVTQIQQGSPADVIATADTATMQKLRDAGLVDPPTSFAGNRLEILVPAGNPHRIATLADLTSPDLKVVLADDTVPAGKYAAQALQAAGVTVRPVSKEVDVKAAVAKVSLGEADATIVYVTDVEAAGAKAQGVPIPDGQNVVAVYPIAVVTASHNRAGAAAFVDAVVHGPGQAILHRRGFASAA